MISNETEGLCHLCKTRYATDSGFCEECKTILDMMKDLITSYLEDKMDKRAKDFLPELDFLFMRNVRVMAYFNASWEICLEFLVNGGKKIEKDIIKEFEATLIDTQKIIKLLKESKIITTNQSDPKFFFPGTLAKQLLDIKLAKIPFESKEFYMVTREVRAILCLVITRQIIIANEFNPKEILSIFSMLYNHIIICNEEGNDITPIIPKDRVDYAFNSWGLKQRQQGRIIRDIFGLHPGGPRLIKDFKSDAIILKREVVIYLDYVRERIRERERKQNAKM